MTDDPGCDCAPERPPHSCWAERWLVTFAAVSWISYGRYILPHLDVEDFAPGRWRNAFVQLKASGRYCADISYWAVPGTEPKGADIPRLVRRLKDLAQRRRLIWAAQEIAAAAWRTDRPFDATDAARILDGATAPEPSRLRIAA
jgi:hypothetical protein